MQTWGKPASYRAGRAGQIPYVELAGMWIVKEDWLETRWTEAEELAAAKRAAAAQQQQQTEAKRTEPSEEVRLPRGRHRPAEGKSVAAADAGKPGPVTEGGRTEGDA